MNFDAKEWRSLALPLAAALALLAAGAGLIWHARTTLAAENRSLAAARAERAQAVERLARIAEEEREVREKIEIYRRLRDAGILGEEKRLEWVDAIARIRAARELLDLRYKVDRQRLLRSAAGKPASVDFYASTMNVELALLHEGDLLGFLADLRNAGHAYVAVQRCAIARTAQPPSGAGLAPRLRAECAIDLITVMDRAAKT
ncbi:MAG: hypothetical protein N2653_00625 [Burkholderiales bacterium]|nr:hypothetical protein [Burkholderiales bacterium]